MALAALLLACDDVTVPGRDPVHPFAGTWDVTTQLDSFVYESGSSPECPGQLYCGHYRPATGAALVGELIITDTLTASGQASGGGLDAVLRAHGEFGGIGCIRWTYGADCQEMGSRAGRYTSGAAVVDATPEGANVWVVVRMPGEYAPSVHLQGAAPVGDEWRGRVRWELSVARVPPHYRGTFVARRRR